MPDQPTVFPFHQRAASVVLALMLWLGTLTAFGQAPQSVGARVLLPGQTIEREMTGAETHHYKFELKADEFFQVHVEQKGVDVALKLADASGTLLATVDSPNGKQGPETLSYVAAQAGGYVLEVSGFEAKAEKGSYSIKREVSRAATAKDRRRVEVERMFMEGMTARDTEGQEAVAITKLSAAAAGWGELADSYMSDLTAQQVKALKAEAVFDEAEALFYQRTAESYRAALEKFQEASRLYRDAGEQRGEAQSLFGVGLVSDELGEKTNALKFYEEALQLFRAAAAKKWEALTLNSIGKVYADLGEKLKALDYYNQALPLSRDVGDRDVEAVTLNNIGKVYSELGEKHQALKFYEQALAIRQAIGDRRGEASTLDLLQKSDS